MRKVILMMLLAVWSISAAAEWVKFATPEDYTVYFDNASIRKAGDRVKVWELFNYKTQQRGIGSDRYMSAKLQYEYDCKADQYRVLYTSLHSGNMGGGKVLDTGSDFVGEWAPIAPGTLPDAFWKLSCKNR